MPYCNCVLFVFAFTICAFECGSNLQQSSLPQLPLGTTPATSSTNNLPPSQTKQNSPPTDDPQEHLNSLIGAKGSQSPPQTNAILEDNTIVKRSMGRRVTHGRRIYRERKRRGKSAQVEDIKTENAVKKQPMALRQKVYLVCLVCIMLIFLLKRKYDQRIEANVRKESSLTSSVNQESKNSIEIVRQKYFICEPNENIQSTPKFGSPLKPQERL